MKKYIFIFLFSASLYSCDDGTGSFKLSGNAIGTTYHINYTGVKIDSLVPKIDSIVFTINHSLSTYWPNSLITAFNTNSNEGLNNPEDGQYFMQDMVHLQEMIRLSKKIKDKTNGAFDPGAKLVFDVYEAAKKDSVEMDQQQLEYALAHSGLDKVEFEKRSGYPMKNDSFVQVNFNAIAKGYLVDLVAWYLEEHGIENYMVEIGGEVRVLGNNSSGESWKVGINTPLVEADPLVPFKVVEFESGGSMATSGNYRNFYEIDGKVVGHTIDPRTGTPIITNLKSASVLHANCAVADAYATAFMVMGLEESIEVVSTDEELSAYFIYEEDNELKLKFVE